MSPVQSFVVLYKCFDIYIKWSPTKVRPYVVIPGTTTTRWGWRQNKTRIPRRLCILSGSARSFAPVVSRWYNLTSTTAAVYVSSSEPTFITAAPSTYYSSSFPREPYGTLSKSTNVSVFIDGLWTCACYRCEASNLCYISTCTHVHHITHRLAHRVTHPKSDFGLPSFSVYSTS